MRAFQSLSFYISLYYLIPFKMKRCFKNKLLGWGWRANSVLRRIYSPKPMPTTIFLDAIVCEFCVKALKLCLNTGNSTDSISIQHSKYFNNQGGTDSFSGFTERVLQTVLQASQALATGCSVFGEWEGKLDPWDLWV